MFTAPRWRGRRGLQEGLHGFSVLQALHPQLVELPQEQGWAQSFIVPGTDETEHGVWVGAQLSGGFLAALAQGDGLAQSHQIPYVTTAREPVRHRTHY